MPAGNSAQVTVTSSSRANRVSRGSVHARVSPVIGAIGASSGAGTAGAGSGSTCARSCLVIRPLGHVRSGPVMAGGLSERAIARLAAFEGGAEATAFLAYLVARGRSSYTVRSYASGLEHFLAWTTA